jgi:dsDNA-binding SOS-regulon protein
MTYDEAIQRAEQLIEQLEKAEALSMDEYKRLALEVSTLLKQCKDEISKMATNLNSL